MSEENARAAIRMAIAALNRAIEQLPANSPGGYAHGVEAEGLEAIRSQLEAFLP